MGATETGLAQFVAEYPAADIPPEILHLAKRCLMNFLGVALYASQDPSLEIFLDLFKAEGSGQAATILGRGVRTTAQNAALANGYLGHLEDFDDSHTPSGIHPASPIFPAPLAVSELRAVSGLHLLAACVIGIEVACRVGNVIHEHRREVTDYWHITNTCGVLGAASGAGRLLRLPSEQMVHAFGIAGTQASGLRELSGSMCKPLHAGKAAQNGLCAAMLAQRGFTATDSVFEGPRGLIGVMASGYDLTEATRDLGRRWELPNNGFKPYACGIVNHGLIDAMLALRQREGVKPEAIQRVDVSLPRLAPSLSRRRHPHTGLDGKFCYWHAAAVALADGAALPAQFTDARVKDRVVAALRDKIELHVDPSLKSHTAAVATLTITDGRTYTERVDYATGTPENPMTDQQVEGKFRALAGEVLPREQVDRAAEMLWQFDKVSDARNVIPLLCAR